MDIIKIIGIGLIALVLCVILKQYKPEMGLYVSLIAGILILCISFDGFTKLINIIENYSDKISVSGKYVTILLKITGIAILSEFACSMCKDCGESAIANKIELASKVMIISASIPIISSLLEVVLRIMP